MKQQMNWKQRVVVVVMDLLLIAELTFSIGMASRQPGDFTLLFVKYYVPMLLVTVVLGRSAIRRFQTPMPETGTVSA